MKNYSINDLQFVIDCKFPEELFSNDLESCKKEYRKLSSIFHPDKNSSIDSSVFAKISIFYENAITKIESGDWIIPGLLQINSIDKRKYEIKYKIKRFFELGEMYIADTHVTYKVSRDNEDLVNNFIKQISSFKFRDDKMKEEFKKYLPVIKSKIICNNEIYLVIEKTKDLISLRDVLDYYDKKLDPKHVAWIVSRFCNLCCYLNYNNQVHCNLDLDSCFISPEYHSVAILGGWFYTTNVNDKFHALPDRTINNGSYDLLIKKKAYQNLDMDIIKTTAKELLGDISGSKLLMDKTIPKSLLQWLKTGSSSNPYEEYKIWSTKILKESFGERKFHEMKLTSEMVYNKIKEI